MLWFWLSGYFLGFLTIAGMAYVIGGHRPRPFIGAALWLVAILWLLIAPSAYRYSVENVEREYVGIFTPHACWCARLLNVPAGYSVGYGVEIGTSVGELWELKTGPIEMFSKPMALDLDRDNNDQLII